MSEMYASGSAGDSGAQEPQSGTVETAKSEAGEVDGTAKAAAGPVVETDKTEAASVARETKRQVKAQYSQQPRELKAQADVTQQRVRGGLRAVGEELGTID